ncbi:MAG: peptidylprolyl isomerase, partial [Cyanobacteriota bacterium]|nr:peptidylprolyl isomerase [Cyanobacteriota bacterium]
VDAPPALNHRRGAIAMARSQAPDSASSQFYITLADLPFLDGNYAVFGYVTQGMEVVDTIQQGDRIESARVVKGLEQLKTN